MGLHTQHVENSKETSPTFDNGIQCQRRSGALCLATVLAKAHNGARICRPGNLEASVVRGHNCDVKIKDAGFS